MDRLQSGEAKMKKGELLLRVFEDATKQWGEDEKIGEDARTSGRLLGRFRAARKTLLAYIKEQENSVEWLVKQLEEKEALVKAQTVQIRELGTAVDRLAR
jgi:hypothetical protein